MGRQDSMAGKAKEMLHEAKELVDEARDKMGHAIDQAKDKFHDDDKRAHKIADKLPEDPEALGGGM